jgi:hypothetical protein
LATNRPFIPDPGAATVTMARRQLGPELTRVAEALYGQLASSVAWFRSQLKRDRLPLAKVLLAGGAAATPGLAEYLERRFGCPVAVFDPFATVAGEPPADRHAWAVAVGLALTDPRLGGSHAVALDLRPEGLVRRELVRRHLIWPWVAAAALVAATIFAGWTLLAHQRSLEETRLAWVDYQARHEKLSAELAAVGKEEAALGEDLRAIASRIWAGRDLLYTVRALKERTLESKELWVTGLETVGIASDEPSKPGAMVDSAIGRGAVLITGKIKFAAADTDTGRNAFLTAWKDWITAWKPAPDAPALFARSTMVNWDPRHKEKVGKDGKVADEGEFSFTARFDFQPTALDRVIATESSQP